MEKNENISRRDALKRMSKTAISLAAVVMLPNMNALASNTKDSFDYIDRCYDNYGNYNNYSNHNDYYNYDNYKNYVDYKDICK